MIDSAWFNQRLIEKGASASDLARFLGVDRSGVSRMLKGQRKMSAEEQDLIAEYLGASLLEVAARRRGESTGFAESKQERYVTLANVGRRDTAGGEAHSSPVHRAFGCMAGTMTIPDDLDLTAPIDVEWSDKLYNE